MTDKRWFGALFMLFGAVWFAIGCDVKYGIGVTGMSLGVALFALGWKWID